VPLKWRISLLVAAVLVTVITVISAVAYHEIQESLLGNIDTTLRVAAKGVLAAMDDSHPAREIEQEIRSITGSGSAERAGRYRLWLEGSASDLYASDPPASEAGQWLRALPAGAAPEPGRTVFFDTGRAGNEYRAVWLRQPTGRGVLNVVVARSSHYARHEIREFLRVLGVLGSAMVLGSVVVAVLIVLWAIRPIGRTAQTLRTITYRNLGREKLKDIAAPSELGPFVTALDEMLARLDEAIQRQKQFTGDASHELRTPLALAKSTLQAARSRDRNGQEYRGTIDEALRDLDRMGRLIDQLLALARLDESNGQAELTDVRLDLLLADLAGSMEAAAARTGGTVICRDMPPTTVRGNEGELAQLFGNLLDNAWRHGPAGGRITISMQAEAPEGVTVRVHDEGGNIPPEALPRLFDRFYRVDPSRAHATGGTGLGLAIAREIARRHGGRIEIASDPATGTVASVHLPRR
jgi:heavy metal sensor kinase